MTTGPHSGIVGETFYTMLHALDPGTIAGDDGTWKYLLAMLLVTFGGLLIFSALIGVISTGLDSRIQDLREGRSLVIEEGHTLILGWGKPVFTILVRARHRDRGRQGSGGRDPFRDRQGRDGRHAPAATRPRRTSGS